MRRLLAVTVVVLLAIGLGSGVGAAAHEEPDRTEIFGVELEADGDATVYHVTAYDLSEDEPREFYESIADNGTAQQEWREEVTGELEAAAATGREETDGLLEMRIRNVSIETYTVDESGEEPEEFGRVEVRAEWDNLAYHSEEFSLEGVPDPYVLVIEPFNSPYEPSHVSMHPVDGPINRVSIHGPGGFERSTRSAPEQLRAQRNSMLWNPRTSDFTEFYALFTGIDAGENGADNGAAGPENGGADGPENGDGGSPEFGIVLRALVFVLVPVALVLLALRRRE